MASAWRNRVVRASGHGMVVGTLGGFKPREWGMADISNGSEREPMFVVGCVSCPLLDACPVSCSAAPLRWPNWSQ